MSEGPEREQPESGEETIDERGRNPTQRRIDEEGGDDAPVDADWGGDEPAGAEPSGDA